MTNENAEKYDLLERAVLEIDAMVSIFCHDFTDESQTNNEEFVITTPEALECARTIIDHLPDETTPEAAFDVKMPRINVEAFVPSVSENSDDGTRLRISLPPGYPSTSVEVTVLSTPKKFPRSQLDELSTKLQGQAKELIGSEAMMEIINECREVMEDWENNKLCHQISDETLFTDDDVHTITESISRRWIWVHHITNKGRLKQIVTEAQDLKLGGYLKGGYPGVVVIEGSSQSCEEFVGWIKGNKSRPGGFGRNWGHHVRGEVDVEERQLPGAFEELEDDMGKFGNLCKDSSVEDEFRDFILQHK